MLEIRFHGRGGQGAVLASDLLAEAAFLDGRYPQSFPFFGVERRGAPVTAYCRIGDGPIGIRTSIVEPDVVVILERGLLQVGGALQGLRPGGWLLVNTRAPPESLPAPPGVRRASVDATSIALSHHLGSRTMPIVNTTILGSLAAITGVISAEALDKAIRQGVPAKTEENCRAAAQGYSAVRSGDPVSVSERPSSPVVRMAAALPPAPIASIPSDVIHTASWRTLKPVIRLEGCTKCNFCWKFCPDDAIEFDSVGFPRIREAYCKGCGICAAECPPRVIEMVEEA